MGALLIAIVLVVVLGIQVQSLRAQLQVERHRVARLSVGQVVPPLPAVTLDGDSVVLGQGAERSRQVLFLFNTTCAFCEETLPAWVRIARQLADEPDVTVLGWSHDPDSLTRAYATLHDLQFKIVVGAPAKYFAIYRAPAVPATIVVGADGQVLYAPRGMLNAHEEDSVLAIARTAW